MHRDLKTVIQIADEAGKILVKYFQQNLKVEYKSDKFDPITQADKEADEFIRHSLNKNFPNDQILSEEDDFKPADYSGRVWIVDPLDGTKDFVAGRDSFAIIIGLLEDEKPKLGVVYAPVTNELFYAEKGQGAFRVFSGKTNQLKVSDNTDLTQARLVTRNIVEGDVRLLDEQLNKLPVKERIPEGSIGLKMGRIAEGKADAFIHSNLKACKWDTLGSQVILTESGGVISDLKGNTLDYTKPSLDWDKYFIATNNSNIQKQILAKVTI